MDVHHVPIDSVVQEAEELVSKRLGTMSIESTLLKLFSDYLVDEPIPDPESTLYESLQSHRPTPNNVGGFYITDCNGQPVMYKFIAEIACTPMRVLGSDQDMDGIEPIAGPGPSKLPKKEKIDDDLIL
ncbi:hypothetical protein F5878DRAFT_647182 [Lentinula raphanica]|uniref:Uncharacterized protein n=1 Tax=Lentinula raphanica TaxID=153919 RepID=A0AA38NWV4_9AGAR|nr:hypothetical protein F5878DRAFT_647182 [Lentinula raphanica]